MQRGCLWGIPNRTSHSRTFQRIHLLQFPNWIKSAHCKKNVLCTFTFCSRVYWVNGFFKSSLYVLLRCYFSVTFSLYAKFLLLLGSIAENMLINLKLIVFIFTNINTYSHLKVFTKSVSCFPLKLFWNSFLLAPNENKLKSSA